MRGLPDWGQPIDISGVTGFATFDAAGQRVLPDALVLAKGPGGAPEFRLTAVRPMVPRPGQRGHGRVEMVLALQAAGASADGQTRAVPALRGWLSLSAAALDLPEVLRKPMDLRCAGTGAIDLVLPLEPEGLGFIETALAEGALPVLARADLEIAGIARRVTGRVTVDHVLLHAAAAAGLTPGALRAGLERGPAGLGVKVESDDPFAVEAALDHLRAVLFEGPMRAGAAELELVWAKSAPKTARTVLDLSQPVMATRALQLLLDPFAEARVLAASTGAGLIHRVVTGALQAGQHRLSFNANLPRPLAGPLATGARLVIPAKPPARTHEIREEIELPPDGSAVDRVIRLAPTEALDWVVEGTAWFPTQDGRGAVLRRGTARAGSGPEVELGLGDYPLEVSRIAASPALLEIGGVEVSLSAGTLTARARLTAEKPEVALALPDAGGEVTVVVTSPEGQRVVLSARAAGDARIELADLPGYGPRQTEIVVSFPPEILLRALDVAVEGEPVQTLAFTPARPARSFTWFCADPFRAGLRWRWHDEPGAEFSAPVTGARLDLHAREGAVA